MAKIVGIKDSIVSIKGNEKYMLNDIYSLSKNVFGIVLSATEGEAKVLAVGNPSEIKMNSTVKKYTGENLISLYDSYFGKIISPFGEIVHGEVDKSDKPKLLGKAPRLNSSPPIIDRVGLDKPLDTGILTIDTMIPIGLGQRELIIGDRSTGKSSIALSAIINQRNKDIKSIYVAIGQKRNTVIALYDKLKEHKALKNSIIIFANPDSSAEQFLAPTIGMAMAEVLAYKGDDVLIVVDDLTKHANIYREISLSIGKNPGREAYPTDVFFQHASLLERSGHFGPKYNNGSITCLPIVETVQGDLASLIPSNVISITDGQIFTDYDKFNRGIFPSINIQLSVSRTGSSVQSKVIKAASKDLKAEYANLSEIKKFADMSIDISDELIRKTEKWDGLNSLLVQYGYEGYPRGIMALLIEMYRMEMLHQVDDVSKFGKLIHKLCKTDIAVKMLVNFMETKLVTDRKKEEIKAIFKPIIDAMMGKYNGVYSKNEYKKIMEAYNG